ncbi:MAG: group 1 glycosyl transferase [bacterium]|nr:MAG: group 1 glycosyl transferase [bacterium]
MTGALESAAPEIAAAHIVAVPSLIEGLPFVVAEAMAAGAVPLVSDLPGLDEVVDDSVGRLLPPDNEEAWTRALLELAGDHETLGRLAKAARARFLERLTRKRMIDGTTAVYGEVLA